MPDDSGGVLIDLKKGNFYELNRTAAWIWRQRLTGLPDVDLPSALSKHFDIPITLAQSDVRAAMAPGQGTVLHEFANPYRFAAEDGGYLLTFGGEKLFWLNRHADEMLILTRERSLLHLHLWNAAPKILGLRGAMVLHAAAAAWSDRVVLLVGDSTAGKSTTQRSFVRNGARDVGDDRLLLQRKSEGAVQVVVGAEAHINAWIGEVKRDVHAGQLRLECGGIDLPADTPCVTPTELLFLAQEQRASSITDFEVRGTTATDAVAETFRQVFFPCNEARVWKEYLAMATNLVASVRSGKLWVPEGVSLLEPAARRYMDTRTP